MKQFQPCFFSLSWSLARAAVDMHRRNVMNELHTNFLNHLLYLPSLWSLIKKKIIMQDAVMNFSRNSASAWVCFRLNRNTLAHQCCRGRAGESLELLN